MADITNKRFFRHWLVFSLTMFMLGLLLFLYLFREYERAATREQEQLLRKAEIISKNTAWNLESLNKLLLRLQKDPALLSNDPGYNQRLEDLVNAMPGVRTMLALDSQGITRVSSRADLLGKCFNDRDYFRISQQHVGEDLLYVSPPFRTILNTYVITLSRILRNTDGSFAGVIAASLDPDYFSTLLQSVLYAPDMRSALAHWDGLLFLMEPGHTEVIGKNIAVSGSFFTRHRTSGNKQTVHVGTVYATGRNQMMAQITINPESLKMNKPLVVAVSRDLDVVYTNWRSETAILCSLFLLCTLATGFGLNLYDKRRGEFEKQKATSDESIRKLNEELDRFFSMSLDMLCIADMEGYFRRLNRSWEETLGYTLDELTGQQFLDFVHPDDIPVTLSTISALTEDKQVLNFINRYRCKDGSYRWIEWRSAPYKNLIYAAARDITELKLTQLQLEQRTAEAEAANRAKSEFLANMSHEIRTPMNAILGLTRLVLETELAPRQKDFLMKVYSSSQALMVILNDILDYSKIEAGRIEIEQLPISVELLVKDVTGLFRAQIEEKGLGISVKLDSRLPSVLLGDPQHLTQVLNNLLGNAVKFTEAGEISINVEQTQEDSKGVMVCFSVQDTGIGLEQYEVNRLFQAFTQADGTISRKYGGTGLGLTISQQLVGLMGSTITVSSRKGHGSNFSFAIQMGKVPPGTQAKNYQTAAENLFSAPGQQSPSYPADQRQLELSGLRVLLVEDNRINQEVAAEILHQYGAVVTLADHGAAAVDLLTRPTFDVVLMDLHMPVMDGFEATRQIRKQYDSKTLPIIAMTAAVLQHDRDRCIAAGMGGFVAKPVNPPELLSQLIHLKKTAPSLSDQIKTTEFATTATTPDQLNFDSSAALSRMGGNRILLNSILKAFVKEHGQSANEIMEMLSRGKTEDARYLAHNIKGVAGTVGAMQLMKTAAELEQQIRSESPHADSALFAHELGLTVSAIASYLREQELDDGDHTAVKQPDSMQGAEKKSA